MEILKQVNKRRSTILLFCAYVKKLDGIRPAEQNTGPLIDE